MPSSDCFDGDQQRALRSSILEPGVLTTVDLNRSHTDEVLYKNQFVTGLCPEQTFDGQEIYLPGENVSADEKRDRIENYWRPYHDRIASSLKSIKESFGCALLWDAHSIPSKVPLLFDGELPELRLPVHRRLV